MKRRCTTKMPETRLSGFQMPISKNVIFPLVFALKIDFKRYKKQKKM